MKKILFAALLLLGALTYTCNAQITVVSPNGGERLPRNGQLYFWWSNSVPLQVSEFLDRYDEGGAYVETIPMVGKGYSIAGVDYAYNLNDIDTSNLPTSRYKLRVIGQASNGQTFSDESDNFFFITADATMSCTAVDASDWLPGHTKAFTITWDGFAVGDPYLVWFLLSDDYLGESYGFILKSGTIESENGTITFDAPFPTEAMSLDPQYPSVPADANYVAMFWNGRNYLRTQSAPVSVILKEVHVRVFEQKDFQTELLKPMTPLSLTIDTRYAHEIVQTLTIPIIGASSVTNAEFICALFDKNRQVSEARLIKMTDKGGYGYAEFRTHGFTIPPGTRKSLELRVIPIRGVGLCQFGVNRDETLSATGRRREEITTAVSGRWGPLITVTSRVPRR